MTRLHCVSQKIRTPPEIFRRKLRQKFFKSKQISVFNKFAVLDMSSYYCCYGNHAAGSKPINWELVKIIEKIISECCQLVKKLCRVNQRGPVFFETQHMYVTEWLLWKTSQKNNSTSRSHSQHVNQIHINAVNSCSSLQLVYWTLSIKSNVNKIDNLCTITSQNMVHLCNKKQPAFTITTKYCVCSRLHD